MTTGLRIAVADDDPDVRAYFATVIAGVGHEVVAVAATGRELVQRCRETRPDLVLTDIRMPDMDGLEAAVAVARERPVPFVIVSAYADPDLVDRAAAGPVLAYLVKPVKPADLAPAIALAVRRFAQLRDMADQVTGLRQALEERKVIERAKGVLMKRTGLTEPDAQRRLQRLAADQNRKLVEIARSVLTAEAIFAPGPPTG